MSQESADRRTENDFHKYTIGFFALLFLPALCADITLLNINSPIEIPIKAALPVIYLLTLLRAQAAVETADSKITAQQNDELAIQQASQDARRNGHRME